MREADEMILQLFDGLTLRLYQICQTYDSLF